MCQNFRYLKCDVFSLRLYAIISLIIFCPRVSLSSWEITCSTCWEDKHVVHIIFRWGSCNRLTALGIAAQRQWNTTLIFQHTQTFNKSTLICKFLRSLLNNIVTQLKEGNLGIETSWSALLNVTVELNKWKSTYA